MTVYIVLKARPYSDYIVDSVYFDRKRANRRRKFLLNKYLSYVVSKAISDMYELYKS